MLKISFSTLEGPGKENPSPKQSTISWNKYKKDRIYYEETHPRATKKLF